MPGCDEAVGVESATYCAIAAATLAGVGFGIILLRRPPPLSSDLPFNSLEMMVLSLGL